MKTFRIAKTIILGCIILGATSSCKKEDWTNNIENLYRHNEEKVSITQGVWGTLTERTGNWQPVIDGNSDAKEFPIQREIRVYEYTTINDFSDNSLIEYDINAIQTSFVAKTTADTEGFYEITLQPGTYSVFIIENDKLYAGGGDGNGGLNPVIIRENERSKLNLSVHHSVD